MFLEARESGSEYRDSEDLSVEREEDRPCFFNSLEKRGRSLMLTCSVWLLSILIKLLLLLGLISGRISLLMFYYSFFFLACSLICLFLLLIYFSLRVVLCCNSGMMFWVRMPTSLSSNVMYLIKLLQTVTEYRLIQLLRTISKFSSCSLPTWLNNALSPLCKATETLAWPSSRRKARLFYFPSSETTSLIIFFQILACLMYLRITSPSYYLSLQRLINFSIASSVMSSPILL